MKSQMSIKKTFDNELLTLDEMEPQKNVVQHSDEKSKLELDINIDEQIFEVVIYPSIQQYLKTIKNKKKNDFISDITSEFNILKNLIKSKMEKKPFLDKNNSV